MPNTAIGVAQISLIAKAGYREHGRRLGSVPRFVSVQARRRANESFRALCALSHEERDLYLAEKRALWLTKCLVKHPELGVKTFDLKGRLQGVPYCVSLTLPIDASLKDFLLAVLRCEAAPLVMRLDAAKICAPLCHKRVRSQVDVSELLETLEPQLKEAAHG
jgi:hypothetical protein